MEIVSLQPVKETSFYLIFPLADGNLRQFWHRNFPHPSGTNTATYARWVARQFRGLAFALCKLHDLHLAEVHLRDLNDDDDPAVWGKVGDPFYGIHGDIKPENLLWYEDWVGPHDPPVGNSNALEVSNSQPTNDSFGVLQLADFGISRLHHTESRSDTPLRGATKTYAPPEVEYALDGCSRSFDIWGLGCVFLEFICWLVQGGSGKRNPVDVFHDARYLYGANRSLEGTIQDTFYHVVKENHRTTFEVNPEVNRVSHHPNSFVNLKQLTRCSASLQT
jgi:serine/threonine protein kinase